MTVMKKYMINDYPWWDAILSVDHQRRDFWLTLSNEICANDNDDIPVYYDPALKVPKRKVNKFYYDFVISSPECAGMTDQEKMSYFRLASSNENYEFMLHYQYSTDEELQEFCKSRNLDSSI